MSSLTIELEGQTDRVLSNIRLGLTSRYEKEDAVALFRLAACLLPEELAECGICGRNKPVCCNEGYTYDKRDRRVAVGAVCFYCCTNTIHSRQR